MESKSTPLASWIINLIVFFLFGLLFIFYIHFLPTSISFDGWGGTLANLMLFYLVFVLFRTVALLVFSFLDFMAQKQMEPPNHFPLVTILVPGYNEGMVIRTAIQSLAELDYPNFEILVIDDGSKDNMLEEAIKYKDHPRVRIVHKTNGGKSSALNRGIEEARGEFILCMDADSRLDSKVLQKAISFFEQDPLLAAVAGNVIVGNGSSILAKFQKLEYVTGLNFLKTGQSYLGIVNIIPGPIGVFRKKILREMGGYSLNTFAEDCDLTLRILMAGYKVRYCADMVAVTEAPEDFMSLVKQRYRWSRGVFQAMNDQVKRLSWKNLTMRNVGITFTVYIESVVIPIVNFCFAIAAVAYSLSYSNVDFLGSFFIGLTILDVVIAAYSVYTEKSVGSLIILSVVNRLTFGFAMEVIRFFASVDEMLGLPMTWGKLERKGLGPS